MSRIRPTWTPPNVDNPGAFTSGIDLVSDIAVTISGVWWYQPAVNGPANVTVRLYDQGTQAVLATGSGSGLTPGAWNLISLSSSYSASAGVTYTAAAAFTGALGSSPFGELVNPIIDPTGHVTIPANRGRFVTNATGYPSSTWNGMHGVDVEFSPLAEPPPATGSMRHAARAVARSGAPARVVATASPAYRRRATMTGG